MERKKSWHALVYTMHQNSNLFSFIFLVGSKYVRNCSDLDIKDNLIPKELHNRYNFQYCFSKNKNKLSKFIKYKE